MHNSSSTESAESGRRWLRSMQVHCAAQIWGYSTVASLDLAFVPPRRFPQRRRFSSWAVCSTQPVSLHSTSPFAGLANTTSSTAAMSRVCPPFYEVRWFTRRNTLRQRRPTSWSDKWFRLPHSRGSCLTYKSFSRLAAFGQVKSCGARTYRSSMWLWRCTARLQRSLTSSRQVRCLGLALDCALRRPLRRAVVLRCRQRHLWPARTLVHCSSPMVPSPRSIKQGGTASRREERSTLPSTRLQMPFCWHMTPTCAPRARCPVRSSSPTSLYHLGASSTS